MKVYIITSAKFEECYIEEWVKYHLNLGFDKIIINDNNPKNYPYNPKDILQKYIDAEQVIVERYYDTHNIIDCKYPDSDIPNIYTWLYNKYKDEFDWVAKLDIDEFLEIPETNNDIKKFLNQDKFNNVLSLIIPLELYQVIEFNDYYTRLKNNRDKYHKIHTEYNHWTFKSIIKKTDYVNLIHLHYCIFNGTNNDLIEYALSNGENAKTKLLINTNNSESIRNNKISEYQDYIDNILVNQISIKHYCLKTLEEQVNHAIKFEANKYPNFHLYNGYKEFYKYHPEMFEHPRDLYKLYFIDNINNIRED